MHVLMRLYIYTYRIDTPSGGHVTFIKKRRYLNSVIGSLNPLSIFNCQGSVTDTSYLCFEMYVNKLLLVRTKSK
jgi:hypothetical protein